jgi:hypothetical protein
MKDVEARLVTRKAGLAARETAACQPHGIGAEQPESAHQASTGGGDRLGCIPLVRLEEIWV